MNNNNFKIGDRIYCFCNLILVCDNIEEKLITQGIYTISDIKIFSSGDAYKLKEFENTNSFNHFHNIYFISIADARKYKLNQIYKNEKF